MRFLRWAFAGGLIVAFCLLHAQQQMQLASSVPVPDIARRIDFSRTNCGPDGDFVAWLNAGPEDLPHELVHIGANGSLIGHFDLRWTPGFGNGTIKDAALDSSGKTVLLVQNVISSGRQELGRRGQQGGMWWRTDPASWIVTLDNSGHLLSKFSFDQRLAPSQFALFRSRNLLVAGYLRTQEINGPGAVIFTPSGAVRVTLKLPVAEEMDGVAKMRPLPGPGDEVFMAHLWTEPYLMKIFEDGTVEPKVMLTVPKDEIASVQKISGHHAIAFVKQAEPLRAGTITKAARWQPYAVFDTDSGALVQTLLVPQFEEGPVCYSESRMTFMLASKGTLDSLVPKTSNKQEP